jgi:4-diphosphocytidyl-2C-methyl-D-erythritol kinase
MPTPAVYKRFDQMLSPTQHSALSTEPDWPHWSTLSATDLLSLLVNDLEAPAFSLNADLAELHRRANEIADRPVRMSGSGSTLFTLYDDAGEAERSAEQFRLTLSVDARTVVVCPTTP